MKEIKLRLYNEEISFYIKNIKIFYGKNILLKHEIINSINQYISKSTETEYNDEIKRNIEIKLNGEVLNPRDCLYFTISNHFDIDKDIKLGSKSLTLTYIESKLKNIEYNNLFSELISILSKLIDEELSPNNITINTTTLEFKLKDFSTKNIIDLIDTSIIKKGYLANQYDLNYEENINLQIKLLKNVVINNPEKIIFLVFDCELTEKLINEVEKQFTEDNVICLIVANINHFTNLEDIILLNNQILDLMNKETIYDYLLMNLSFHTDLEGITYLLRDYIDGIKNPKTIELDSFL